ncbi:Hsp20/alpha crystallin family protein [Mesobacillus maritimus]|uniref:Hsp20/alpha crystallin family protein n=1 Tax=Mesobacillus maritimus TaxID=1643336 RepID=UPI00203CFB5C|nr:Hsp20/alpha crystallin family protein [Mesobacillus maritimus]MCM3584833.1 Hsp20/alpha crystallin family protein [Mesobacillus maritimus]MCM3671248.1 Hsp20/alpha crystallin family protein [Mesobacillus maritimus]
MDIEKMRKWLEITNEYKKTDFWTKVLEEKKPEEFVRFQDHYPKYDLLQDEYYHYVIVEIPGVHPDELDLKLISMKELRISGRTPTFLPNQIEVRIERFSGYFERVIDLPDETRADLLQISMDKGLLFISFPRNGETIKIPR